MLTDYRISCIRAVLDGVWTQISSTQHCKIFGPNNRREITQNCGQVIRNSATLEPYEKLTIQPIDCQFFLMMGVLYRYEIHE